MDSDHEIDMWVTCPYVWDAKSQSRFYLVTPAEYAWLQHKNPRNPTLLRLLTVSELRKITTYAKKIDIPFEEMTKRFRIVADDQIGEDDEIRYVGMKISHLLHHRITNSSFFALFACNSDTDDHYHLAQMTDLRKQLIELVHQTTFPRDLDDEPDVMDALLEYKWLIDKSEQILFDTSPMSREEYFRLHRKSYESILVTESLRNALNEMNTISITAASSIRSPVKDADVQLLQLIASELQKREKVPEYYPKGLVTHYLKQTFHSLVYPYVCIEKNPDDVLIDGTFPESGSAYESEDADDDITYSSFP